MQMMRILGYKKLQFMFSNHDRKRRIWYSLVDSKKIIHAYMLITQSYKFSVLVLAIYHCSRTSINIRNLLVLCVWGNEEEKGPLTGLEPVTYWLLMYRLLQGLTC